MKKILIIEDDPDLCENIKQIFEFNDYVAITAGLGTEGLKLAKEINPDIILCDIIMPGMDGYEVRNKLGKYPETISIPFIFLSVKNDTKDIRYGLNLGADDYIIKPFAANDLVIAVENRLTRINALKSEPSGKVIRNNAVVKPKRKLSYPEQILVYVKGEPEIIKIAEIIIINSEGDYSTVICVDGRKIFLRKLLKDWEKILPKKIFFRARKTSIINLSFIIKLEKWYSRTLIVRMKNINDPIIISQRMSRLLKERLRF